MNLQPLSQNESLISKDSWPNLVAAFLNNLDRKPATIQTYRKALKNWAHFLETAERHPDVNLILRYKNYLIEKELSPYSIAVYLTALKVFLDYLVEQNLIPYNPAKSIRGLRKPRSRRDALTKDEALRLLSLGPPISIEDYRNKAILMLKFFTGVRDISIVAANVEDLKVTDGKYLLYYQGKGRDLKEDFVVLDRDVYDAIHDYLGNIEHRNPKAPLFESLSDRNNGSRLSTQSIRNVIKDLFLRAGIVRPEIKPHSLRHTAITFSILGGSSLTQAQEMAGHADIQTTAGYFHDVNRLKDPAESYISKYLHAEKVS